MNSADKISTSNRDPAYAVGADTLSPKMARALWLALSNRLDQWHAEWRTGISVASAPPLRPLASFETISDDAVFKAFAIAAISGNARWDRIAAVRDELTGPFQDFSPVRFAALNDKQVDGLLPWFRERRAGSPRLRPVLVRLRETARILGCDDARSASGFLCAVAAEARGSPETMAAIIGTGSSFKLPGFGIALAAEALRLLGCDLCKPDRHVLRTLASWQIIHYRHWPDGNFTAPQASTVELLATMFKVRALASANGVGVSFATSAIWLAGAVSGARLTNLELARLSA